MKKGTVSPPPENPAFHGQALPLIIVEPDAFLAKLLSEHAIIRSKVLDHILLLMVDPVDRDQEQRLPGLWKGIHKCFGDLSKLLPRGCMIQL
jgi:hypothetical protein